MFRVEPDDAVIDPLLDYFEYGGGFIGGGIRSVGVLGEKPFAVKLDLNEWFRFDKPGMYHASRSALNARVTTRKAPTTMQSVVPVESNTVVFEILPRDLDWEATEAGPALQILNSKGSDTDHRERLSDPPVHRH